MWGYFNQSCLDGLFSKDNLAIEELLDVENIINDVKMNQSKFGDYMIKNPHHLLSLVKYALNLPSKEIEEKSQYKYPFVSSELLGIQIAKISEFFFTIRPQVAADNIVESEQPQSEAEQPHADATEKVAEVTEQTQETSTQPPLEPEKQEVPVVEQPQEQQDQSQEEKQDPLAEQQNQQQEEQQEKQEPSQTEKQEPTTSEQHPSVEVAPQQVQEPVEAQSESQQPKEQTQVEEVKTEQAEQSETSATTTSEQTSQEQPKEQPQAKEEENEVHQSEQQSQKEEKVESAEKPEAKEESEDKNEEKENSEDEFVDDDDSKNNSDHKTHEHEHVDDVYGEDLLKEVFNFLVPKVELNSTSAGYFSKIVLHLVNSRDGQLFKYLESHPQVIQNLLHHLYLKSISKVILALITQDGIDKDPDEFVGKRVELLNQLHQIFATSQDHEVLLNIQDILAAVNNASFKPLNFDVKRALFSTQNIDILIESITKHKESFSQAALTLSSYLDHYRQTIYNETPNEDGDSGCGDYLNFSRKNDEQIDKEFPLNYIQSQTGSLIKALMEENLNVEVPSHQTQYGATVQPFGLNRVKLLHLVLCLLKTENEQVNNALVEKEFFKYLLNLINKHPWNNILHNQIEQIFTQSFKLAVNHVNIRESIISSAQFIQFIVDHGLDIKTKPGTSTAKINIGYVCLLVNFANQIIEQKEQFEWLNQAVEETPKWQEFVDGTLKSINELHKKNLGDQDPRKRKESAEVTNNDLTIKDIYLRFMSMYQNNNQSAAEEAVAEDEEIEANADDDTEKEEDKSGNVSSSNTNEHNQEDHKEEAQEAEDQDKDRFEDNNEVSAEKVITTEKEVLEVGEVQPESHSNENEALQETKATEASSQVVEPTATQQSEQQAESSTSSQSPSDNLVEQPHASESSDSALTQVDDTSKEVASSSVQTQPQELSNQEESSQVQVGGSSVSEKQNEPEPQAEQVHEQQPQEKAPEGEAAADSQKAVNNSEN